MSQRNNISEEEIWEFIKGSNNADLNKKIQTEAKNNPEFKKELNEMTALWNDLNSIQEHKDLKESFHQFHHDNFAPIYKEKKKNSKRKIWITSLSIAAGFALIFTVGKFAYFNNLTANSEDSAYKEMYKGSVNDTHTAEENEELPPSKSTAFAINDSLIMTSFHAIKENESMQVLQSGTSKWINAEFYAGHEEFDIAILKIIPDSLEEKTFPIYFEDKPLLLGQAIYGLGYPKDDLVFGRGDISSLTGYNRDTNSIQVSVPTNPGNSGTPLFDEKGGLIAMTIGKNIQEDGSAYAVSNIQILAFLKVMSISTKRRNLLKRKKQLDQIEKLKPSIFLLKS